MTDETFGQLLDEARLSLRNIRFEVAELRVYLTLKRLFALSYKAGFNPAQLRLPAGQPGGGRWTDGDGGDIIRSVPDTSVTVYSRDMGNTLRTSKGFATGSRRQVSSSQKPIS